MIRPSEKKINRETSELEDKHIKWTNRCLQNIPPPKKKPKNTHSTQQYIEVSLNRPHPGTQKQILANSERLK